MFHWKQTVQTSMRTYLCVTSMHAARSAVFVRTGRVLSITSQATRNLFVLEGTHRHRNLLFQLVVHWSGTGLVWMFHSKQTVPTSMCMYIYVMGMFWHSVQCLCVRGRVLSITSHVTSTFWVDFGARYIWSSWNLNSYWANRYNEQTGHSWITVSAAKLVEVKVSKTKFIIF